MVNVFLHQNFQQLISGRYLQCCRRRSLLTFGLAFATALSAQPTIARSVVDNNTQPSSIQSFCRISKTNVCPSGIDGGHVLTSFVHPTQQGRKDLSRNEPLPPITVVDYYRRRLPIPHPLSPPWEGFESHGIAHAEHLRDRFILNLLPDFGPIIGFKAALTSAPAQERFGVDHPLRGVLLQDMLLESGATVPADFGARPLFEPDLIVRVRSAAINHATTHQEVVSALDAVIPFVELPDMMFAPEVPLAVTDLLEVNVGARLGVMGEAIALPTHNANAQDWVETLGNISVEMVAGSPEDIANGGGEAIASGSSQALMGHPLDVVLWLVEDLQRSGQGLRPGDLLSLGSITAPMPVIPGQTIEAQYIGLTDEPLRVTVTFSDEE